MQKLFFGLLLLGIFLSGCTVIDDKQFIEGVSLKTSKQSYYAGESIEFELQGNPGQSVSFFNGFENQCNPKGVQIFKRTGNYFEQVFTYKKTFSINFSCPELFRRPMDVGAGETVKVGTITKLFNAFGDQISFKGTYKLKLGQFSNVESNEFEIENDLEGIQLVPNKKLYAQNEGILIELFNYSENPIYLSSSCNYNFSVTVLKKINGAFEAIKIGGEKGPINETCPTLSQPYSKNWFEVAPKSSKQIFNWSTSALSTSKVFDQANNELGIPGIYKVRARYSNQFELINVKDYEEYGEARPPFLDAESDEFEIAPNLE